MGNNKRIIPFRRVIVAAAVVFSAVAHGQAPAPADARDLKSQCRLLGVPAVEQMTVSWSGECVEGGADGVGDLFAFANGRLAYILRGQFRSGRLVRQDRLRACESGGCADDAPPSLLRAHEQAATQTAPTAAPTARSQSPIVPSKPREMVLNRERLGDALYTGRVALHPATQAMSGDVVIEYDDRRRFEGRLVEGKRDGRGSYVWADGQRYVGDWVQDVQHGRGTLTFANGDVYEGDFVNGERTGSGMLRLKNGDSYTGQWLRGSREGKGVAEWGNGLRYEGEWKANRREGQGNMRFPNGGSYDGDWRDDQATGRGDILFATGDSYTGEVRDGLPHGRGIMRWGSGDRFEGEFAAGRPTANGEMIFFAEAVGTDANGGDAPAPVVLPPLAPNPVAAASAGPSRADLCASAYNAARDKAALKRFVDSFPDDECGRHSWARQKIAAWEEREKRRTEAASKAQEELVAVARSLVGGTAPYRQEYTYCVTAVGTGSACQRVTYVFDVKARITNVVDVQRKTFQVQVIEATSLGNEKGAPSQLFNDGRAAATAEFRSKVIGSTQVKTAAQLGLAF